MVGREEMEVLRSTANVSMGEGGVHSLLDIKQSYN